jgi:hypothetical protein
VNSVDLTTSAAVAAFCSRRGRARQTRPQTSRASQLQASEPSSASTLSVFADHVAVLESPFGPSRKCRSGSLMSAVEGEADTPDHLKVTRSEASSSRALATSSAREPLANRRLLYDEKRPPTFVGHPAASKFSSSATAEATLGALRA